MTQTKDNAQKFLESQVKALTFMRKTCGNIRVLTQAEKLQLCGLAKLCELLDIEYIREDWEGNSVCDSNLDIIYFYYAGYKFFELVDKCEL